MIAYVEGVEHGGQEGKYMNYRNMEMVNSGMFLMDIFTSKVN